MKTYLRITQSKNKNEKPELELFEGDIEQDKKYWKKHHNCTARYFELKEKKG